MNIKEERAQRAADINRIADSAKTESDRYEVIRLALSSNIIESSVTTPQNLAGFIATCWDQGINPLPAFRRRLGSSWIVVAHCYATQGEVPPDHYRGELYIEIPVNATGVQFRRV